MNNKIKGLLYSTAILASLGGVSVNTYASEINEPTNEPATQEYIAPEVTAEPAPEPVHIIEETQQTLEQAETPYVEPTVVEPIQEPVQEPILNETGQEKIIEEDNVTEPVTQAPQENVKPAPVEIEPALAPAPVEKIEQEENKNLVQNPEKTISQEKITANELGGAGNYKISAQGTGTIVVYIGRKTVEHEGIIGEISGIYRVNVVDGKIDAQDLYLLSLAEDSYLYGTGNVIFEILPYFEPTSEIEPEAPIETEEEKTQPSEPETDEKPAMEQEKETPTVEPETEEKENVKEETKGKFVGLYQSNSELGRVAGVYFDKDTNTLNFEGYEYYLTNADKLPKPIKISTSQKSVTIENTECTLLWENGNLVGMEVVEKSHQGQDDDINQKLNKYPTFSNNDRNDYDAEALKKYEYIDIDDENLTENQLSYTAEKLGFYYTNNSFGFDIKNFQIAINGRKATRIKGIALPSDFANTDIFKQEVGKVHYLYTFTKNIQGGYDLVVIYFRLEQDGTLTIVQDFHTSNAKGARYADIFAKIELEPIVEPEKPIEEPTKPAPASEEPKEEIIEEEKVIEVKGKGVTPSNDINHEPAKKVVDVKPEKEEAAPVKNENVKQEVEEENVPETGNTLLNSNVFGILGVAISSLGTAIFKFRKQ